MVKIAVAVLALMVAASEDQNQPTLVPYTEVGHRVQITGRFGPPIGTYLELSGAKFSDSKGPTKSGGANFRVESVNGKKLSPPLEIWIEILRDHPVGKRFKVTGYETGQMIGVPQEVLEKTGLPSPQAGWQFVVEFVPLKVLH